MVDRETRESTGKHPYDGFARLRFEGNGPFGLPHFAQLLPKFRDE